MQPLVLTMVHWIIVIKGTSIEPPSDKDVVFRALVFLNVSLLFAQDLSSFLYSLPRNLFVCFNGTSYNRFSTFVFCILITRYYIKLSSSIGCKISSIGPRYIQSLA